MNEIRQKPVGYLTYTVFRNGSSIEVFSENNLIVSQARMIDAHRAGGESGYELAKIAFGSSGATAEPGDLVITDAFIKPLDLVSYVGSSAIFNFSLLDTEANGLDIHEFGLLTESGLLYARRIRSAPLPKTAEFNISGTWTITY